jgi:23S rRNA pseudouridine955/2504/2580 synthase
MTDKNHSSQHSPGSPRVQHNEIDEGSAGQRVDNYLLKVMKGVPKTRIYRSIRKGEVRVNKKRVQAHQKLALGDLVRVPPIRMSSEHVAEASQGMKSSLSDAILYESEALLVINKPTGMAVHGGSGVSLGVIETLRQMRPESRYLELVHRLDRETSGCLMVAKKPRYLKEIQKLLQSKDELGKHYICIVHGRWPKRKQVVNLPLAKNVLASGERISRVQADGKASRTEYDVLDGGSGLSVLAVRPITGRTHQIRVHCTASGFPIVGDSKYGDEGKDQAIAGGVKRLMLHAERLVIPALAGYPAVTVTAPTDARFAALYSYIKQSDSR